MSFLKSFSFTLLTQGLMALIGFANGVVVTRALGPEGRGEYSVALSLLTTAALFFGDGLSRSNTFLTSRQPKNTGNLMSNTLLVGIPLGLSVLMVPWLAPGAVAALFPGLGEDLIWLAFACTVPVLIHRALTALSLGLERFKAFNFFQAAPLALFLGINVAFFFVWGLDAWIVLRNYLVAFSVLVVIQLIHLVRENYPEIKPRPAFLAETWRLGVRATISNVSLFLLFRVDLFLVNYYLGKRAAGFYSLAALLAEFLQRIANTAGTVLFPRVARDPAEAQRLTLKVYAAMGGIGLMFGLGAWALAEPLIGFVYTDAFRPAYTPLLYLLPGTIIMSAAKIINFSLWGQGFPRITMVAPVASLVLNTVLNVIMIPRFGMVGAAVSTSISYAVFGGVMTAYFFRRGR